MLQVELDCGTLGTSAQQTRTNTQFTDKKNSHTHKRRTIFCFKTHILDQFQILKTLPLQVQ